MDFFGAMRVSATGLEAQQKRMGSISSNIANAESTSADGIPYRRKTPVLNPETDRESFGEILEGALDEHVQGVRVTEIHEDDKPPRMVYNPSHPHADANGYVAMPNVNTVQEMADMISAQRAYEANVTALNSAKQMARKALDVGR